MINNILQYLEKNALNNPEKIALCDEFRSFSYREYRDASLKIAKYLTDNMCNGMTNRPIAVLIDRNTLSVLAFMGIAYTGNFYVPIDSSLPFDRKQAILDALNPLGILDARETCDEASLYVVKNILNQDIQPDYSTIERLRDNFADVAPLYAIYTSGSTGMPKGVVVSHGSVIDLVNSFFESFQFSEDTIFGNQAPFDFDVSVKDIYNSLFVCGTVEIIPKRMFISPKLLVDYLEEKKINTLIWAVSALRIVADFKVLDLKQYDLQLKNVMFSGEVMPIRVLNYWRKHFCDARYVNLYGPTEITCNCTYHIVDKEYELDEVLPIGKAFPNTRIVLKDENNNIVTKPGELGEICVGGRCVALGYWGDNEKTAKSFIQSPEGSAFRNLVYATGDLGFYNEDGNLVFSSRKDHQIKHMGHRIELGEIETHLNAMNFLVAGICVYSHLQEKIICFYQSTDNSECKKQIAIELSKKLPKFMLPNVYCHMETLPLNKNGKIDRVLLLNNWEKNNG